jgi:hypothetical protein
MSGPKDVLMLIVLIPFVFLLLVGVAAAPIWAVNQLFETGIEYTGWNLFASFLLVNMVNLGD